MESCACGNLAITIDKEGADRYSKVTYPIRYGRYGEIKTPQYILQFNLNGELRYIRGLSRRWPHPAEWLKRTDANDWVFYSAGLYRQMFSFLGEHYLPCLSYPSNSPWRYDPFTDCEIRNAVATGFQLRGALSSLPGNGVPPEIKQFLSRVVRQDATALHIKSARLHRIIGGSVSVLPPDTRHVDYNVIPLMIADGCLYNCSFCRIKSHRAFRPRSWTDVFEQIRQLQCFYGDDLGNYNAVFLGNHDALAAGSERIPPAVFHAYEAFGFETSRIKNPTLFLFGSVDSLLHCPNSLLDTLNQGPMYTYINIGLESADAATLSQINKPLAPRKVADAFERMLDINRSHHNIEITANFLLGDALPPGHYRSLMELVRNRLDRYYSKGALYLSPLDTTRNPQRLLRKFVEIKNQSRLPTYIYLIQRL